MWLGQAGPGPGWGTASLPMWPVSLCPGSGDSGFVNGGLKIQQSPSCLAEWLGCRGLGPCPQLGWHWDENHPCPVPHPSHFFLHHHVWLPESQNARKKTFCSVCPGLQEAPGLFPYVSCSGSLHLVQAGSLGFISCGSAWAGPRFPASHPCCRGAPLPQRSACDLPNRAGGVQQWGNFSPALEGLLPRDTTLSLRPGDSAPEMGPVLATSICPER